MIQVPQVAEDDNVDRVVDEEQQVNVGQPVEQPVEQQVPHQDNEAALRRSTRVRKSAIPSNYVIYL